MIIYYSNENDKRVKNSIHFYRVKGWNISRIKGEKRRGNCLQIFTNEQIPIILHSDEEELINSWNEIILKTLEDFFVSVPPSDMKSFQSENDKYLSLDVSFF